MYERVIAPMTLNVGETSGKISAERRGSVAWETLHIHMKCLGSVVGVTCMGSQVQLGMKS